MSDINPMTGQPFNPEPTVQSEPQQRVNFEDPSANQINELINSEEAREFQKLANAASRTKFATGDRATDMRNYMNFKSLISGLVGFMDKDD